jgi:hypothetical protein
VGPTASMDTAEQVTDLTGTRIPTLGRPARSHSLYLLRYPSPYKHEKVKGMEQTKIKRNCCGYEMDNTMYATEVEYHLHGHSFTHFTNKTDNITIYVNYRENGPPLWSVRFTGPVTQRSRVLFPALSDFLSSSKSGTGSTQPSEDR